MDTANVVNAGSFYVDPKQAFAQALDGVLSEHCAASSTSDTKKQPPTSETLSGISSDLKSIQQVLAQLAIVCYFMTALGALKVTNVCVFQSLAYNTYNLSQNTKRMAVSIMKQKI